MEFQNFPKIINEKISPIGSYKQKLTLTKGYIAKDSNSLFLPIKDRNFSPTSFLNNKKKKNGYLLEILFHGLNYSAKRLKLKRKSFLIDVHKSEIFINKEPLDSISKSRIYKRRLVFFSYDNQNIRNIEAYIKKMKVPNSYTGKGIFSREDTYKIKKVKKRKK